MRCAVFGCNTDNGSKTFDESIRFFTFPKDKEMCRKWVHLCKRKDTFNTTSSRICSKHFVKEDYVRNLQHELLGYSPKNGRFRALKNEAVPSKNLPSNLSLSVNKQNVSRNLRHKNRNGKEVVEEIYKGVNTEGDDRDKIITDLRKKVDFLEREEEN